MRLVGTNHNFFFNSPAKGSVYALEMIWHYVHSSITIIWRSSANNSAVSTYLARPNQAIKLTLSYGTHLPVAIGSLFCRMKRKLFSNTRMDSPILRRKFKPKCPQRMDRLNWTLLPKMWPDVVYHTWLISACRMWMQCPPFSCKLQVIHDSKYNKFYIFLRSNLGIMFLLQGWSFQKKQKKHTEEGDISAYWKINHMSRADLN